MPAPLCPIDHRSKRGEAAAAFGRRIPAFSLVALASFASAAWAQQPAPTAAAASEPEPAVLPAVQVRGTQEMAGNAPKPFAGGQVARGSRQGMLGNADVFDTPFSTKSYTAELIRNQGARTVNDVVANDPSIRTSLSATGPLDQSSIRGFVSYSDAYLFDGVQGLASYSSIAVQNYERVEVFKGPSAALSGAGGYGTGVGGGFNLVPKRATDAPVRSIDLSVTRGPLYGTHVDLGQRFGNDNAFGLRLNVTTENGDFYNGAGRRLVAPLLALDFRGERVRLTLDAGSVSYTSNAGFLNRRLQVGAELPDVPDPRTNPNAEWDSLKLDQTFGLLSGEWDFADGWTAYARYGRLHEEPSKRVSLNTTPLDSDGNFSITGYSSYLWKQDNEIVQVGTRGELKTGPVRHLLAFSFTQDRERYHDERFAEGSFDPPIAGSIYERPRVPYPFAGGVPDVEGADYPTTVLESFALADTLTMLDDRLRLTLALRHQSIEVHPDERSEVTPTVALLYKLGNGLSVYGNYAEALSQGDKAPDEATNPGDQLPPYVSRQRELGLKWNGGNYGVTAAVFDIRKAFGLLGADGVFRAAGLQRNRGVELETFGEPITGFRVLGGVAWIDAKQLNTPDGATDGKDALGVPDLTANLGAEWDMPALQGLTVTGRFIHTASAWVNDRNTQRVPSWNTVDVGARYRLRVARSALTLRLSIDNLFDDEHWTVGGREFVSVAPPRTWKVSASFDM